MNPSRVMVAYLKTFKKPVLKCCLLKSLGYLYKRSIIQTYLTTPDVSHWNHICTYIKNLLDIETRRLKYVEITDIIHVLYIYTIIEMIEDLWQIYIAQKVILFKKYYYLK